MFTVVNKYSSYSLSIGKAIVFAQSNFSSNFSVGNKGLKLRFLSLGFV